jgi:beta-lactamase superfamily II metal-dependent hydrolase
MDDIRSPDDAETGRAIQRRRKLTRRILWFTLVTLFFASISVLVGFGLGKYREQTAVASKRLQVTVLNVGHGEAAWIRTPGGKFILIGSGPPEAGDAVVASLRSAGARQIDLLVLPYGYGESIGGAPTVLSAFPVVQVIEPGGPRVNRIQEEVQTLLAAHDIPVKVGRAGDSILVDGAALKVLAPVEPLLEATPATANNSLVIRLSWGKTGFLFAGGMEREGEDALIARSSDTLRSDWLRVARFGSREASSPEFLHLVAPDIAVISVGAGNSGQYPHQETLEQLSSSGARVFRTDQTSESELTFFSDGRVVSVPEDLK